MTTSHSSASSSSDRRSFVEDVETVDPSIAVQLLNLAGQLPKTPRQQLPSSFHHSQNSHPYHSGRGSDPIETSAAHYFHQPPHSNSNSNSTGVESPMPHNTLIKSTHGSDRKKQKMLRAQKAAAEAQIEDAAAVLHASASQASAALSARGDDAPKGKANANTNANTTTTDMYESTSPTLSSSSPSLSPPDSNHTNSRLRGRRAGSRRHAALPMNKKRTEENQDVPDYELSTASIPRVKKPRQSMNSSDSSSNSNSNNNDTANRLSPLVVSSTPIPPESKSSSKSSSKKKKSGSKSSTKIASDYTDHDILLGLHKFNNHPGNQVYRETVMKFREELKGLSKTEIARKIVDHIYHDIGGRFLKIDNRGRWNIMPDADVMTKVGKAISELRNKSAVTPKKALAIRKELLGSSGASALEMVGRGGVDADLLAAMSISRGRPKRKASLATSRIDYSDDAANESTPNHVGSSSSTSSSNGGGGSRKKKSRLSSETGRRAQGDEPPTRESRGSNFHKFQQHQQQSIERKYEEYTYKPDPNDLYVEETAHIYHNPPLPSEWSNGVSRDDLRPIPPPPPLPTFPNTGSCRWSFDDETRVLIADFSVGNSSNDGDGDVQPVLTLEDSRFLFEMYERNDMTVISRGLLNMSRVDPSLWSLDYLRSCVGREFYHKFRRFDRKVDEDGTVSNEEKDRLYSMRFEDYVRYCEKRESHLNERRQQQQKKQNQNQNGKQINGERQNEQEQDDEQQQQQQQQEEEEEPTFVFEDHQGKTHTLGVWTTALYMIDVDMKRLTPLLNENFLESFELPAVLPGGSHCMMNSVTPDARPFMGPNLYVTPPASFTHFHQDGHGTVDSGHLCISGYNEVVMLRRLTERHKKHALWILSGKKMEGSHFDGLYSMPHGDGLGQKPPWPSNDMIEDCKKMGYCPSLFILEPGDLVHINKGRLHAFRKMSTSELPEWDCHAKRRQKLVESKGIAGEEKMCVSVAWDWMYRGVSPAGINREVCSVLEGSALNRKNDVTSLAIPELALLQMAKTVPARSVHTGRTKSFLDALEKKVMRKHIYESTKEDICRGISPGLSVVVGQHIKALNVEESRSTLKGERLSIAKIPDTQENPQTCPLDPYGDSDFQCKLCRKELSNVYFHCDGCEKLLSKDFNICRGCYLQGKFMIKVQMHPSNPKRHATLNHMGDNKFDRESRCPCKNGPACNFCGYCLGCSCRCHTWFTMRTRLCNAVDEEKLLRSVRCTMVPPSASPAVENGNKPKTELFEVEESTKYLLDRLKDAGDEELLNEERNDLEIKEEEEEDSPGEDATGCKKNDDSTGNGSGDVTEKSPRDSTKDDAKTETDAGSNAIPAAKIKEEVPSESKNNNGSAVKPKTNDESESESDLPPETSGGSEADFVRKDGKKDDVVTKELENKENATETEDNKLNESEEKKDAEDPSAKEDDTTVLV